MKFFDGDEFNPKQSQPVLPGPFKTECEKMMWDALVKEGLHPLANVVFFKPWECDLVFMREQVDVEIDGDSKTHGWGHRDFELRRIGWKVLRFSNREISGNIVECVRVVKETLDERAKEFAEKGWL